MTSRVSRAMYNTPSDYLAKTMASRSGTSPDRAGSYYPNKTPIQVFEMLETAKWEPYAHKNISPPAQGFRAKIAGRMGMVRIETLPNRAMLRLEDPKGTGELCAVFESPNPGTPVDFTVALIGPDNGKEIMWTVFPGDPIQACIAMSDGKAINIPEFVGSEISKEEALDLGMEWAKLAEIEPA